jgi:hypothetical protein
MFKSEAFDDLSLSNAVIAAWSRSREANFFVRGIDLGFFGHFLPPPSVLGSKAIDKISATSLTPSTPHNNLQIMR